MTSRSTSALRKSTAQRKPNTSKSAAKARPAKLPEWNLADLYSGIDAPEITRDLTRLDTECVAFETDYKAKLAQHTAQEGGGKWLAAAIKRYEAIEDLAGQLFHEKSQSGYAAWNRLFDQTISGLRFKVSGRELAIEPTLNLLQDRAPLKRKAAAQALAKTFKANERAFALTTNTLAKDKEISDRWRGFQDVADARHLANRVEREVVDALVRPGKAPGAFSHPTTPSAHPYVLMNYQGKPRDVMTLAHELGHGVHQVLAARNGALMAPTPLTLAETASVFGEMLTFKRLLSQTKNAKQRQALLAGKVEDMINTVVRQIAFYSFERAIHTERKNGELTAERIGQIWLSVQGESLGPAIDIRPGYENFWMYIPHFIHSPFYVYAYAFGDCLVNSLYAVYENASEGFAERYLAMLAAGGTKHYSELLKPFGLDAKDPKFWDGGLSVIAGMIDELEAMS